MDAKTSKKILLVNPSYRITKTSNVVLRLEPPVALLNLATYLRTRGYEADIVNTSFEDVDWDKVRNGNYFLAGFTVFIGEFLKNAGALSARMRAERPDMPIVWGGVMASLIPGEILEQYPVDYVVRYEGEYTLSDLADALNGDGSISEIAGLSHRYGDQINHNPPRPLENDLDKFPVPDWNLFDGQVNEKQVPYYFRIMSSKGCPFNCSFCYKHCTEESLRSKSPVWRYRSAEHVINEIDAACKLTGTRVITFGDDNFLVAGERTRAVLGWMRERGLFIEQCIAHLNNLTDRAIGDMAGVTQTAIYAIETASPRLQKIVNKKLKLERVPQVNRALFDAGITSTHNFIIGLPTETDEDLRANVELMLRLKEINPFVRAVAYMFLPLPATPLSTYIEKEMGLPLPNSLDDYERADFDSGNPEGRRFRPWLDAGRYDLLDAYSRVFCDAFQALNMELSIESKALLHDDSRLAALFAGVESARKPRTLYRPYVLDRVLKGEPVDLLNDLKKHA